MAQGKQASRLGARLRLPVEHAVVPCLPQELGELGFQAVGSFGEGLGGRLRVGRRRHRARGPQEAEGPARRAVQRAWLSDAVPDAITLATD